MGWLFGLLGAGGVATLIAVMVFVPGAAAMVFSFFRAVFAFLMRVSVPLLVFGLVLLVLCGGFIWRYGIVERRAERTEAALSVTEIFAGDVCRIVGLVYVPEPVKGKKTPKREAWGKDCLTQLREAVRFKAEAERQTAEALRRFQIDQDEKRLRDTEAAQRNSTRRQRAEQRMEAADAAVQDDTVDAGWFADLGILAGLRDTQGSPAEGGSVDRDAEGEAVGGSPDLRAPT